MMRRTHTGGDNHPASTPPVDDLGASFSFGAQLPFGVSQLPGAENIEFSAEERIGANSSFVRRMSTTTSFGVGSATAGEANVEEATSKLPDSVRPGITPREMVAELLKVAAPCVVSIIFMFAIQTLSMSFVGHRMGFIPLAQFAVGLSVYNVIGASIGIGFTGAIDTLGPQAFGRDAKTLEMRYLLHRAFLFHCAFIFPLAFLFYSAEPVLVSIFGPVLGGGGATFLRATPLLMFITWITSAFTRIFPSQHLANIPLFANIAGTVTSFAVNAHFISETSTMYDVVWCLTVIQCAILAVLVAFAEFHPDSLLKGFYKPSMEAFERGPLKQFFWLGTAAMVGTCSEWWAYELLQALCARIGDVEVAAFTIILNILLLYFSVAIGISIGGGTMIGNALGSNQPDLAKKYMHLTLGLAAVIFSATVLSILVFGTQIVSMYTQDPTVLATLTPLIPFLAFWHLLDAAASATLGLFRGAGKQKKAASTALFSLWLVGLPSAAIGGLYMKMGLYGVLLGTVFGVTLLIPLRVYDMIWWDWKTLAQEASSKPEEGGPMDEELVPPAIHSLTGDTDASPLEATVQLGSGTEVFLHQTDWEGKNTTTPKEDQRHAAIDELLHVL